MTLQKTSNQITLVTFIAVIAAPMLFFSSKKWSNHTENRAAAVRPALPTTLAQFKSYPKGLETYLNDHFGFRDDLIALRSWITYSLFSVSSSEDVLIGNDNWLYYTADESFVDYRGENPLSEAELANWYGALKERRDWLAAQGIVYFFVWAPNKQSIYPEYLPDYLTRGTKTKLDQLVEYLEGKGEPSLVVDLRPALRSAKKSLPLFHQIDVHWNPYGAYLGYAKMADHVADKNANSILKLDVSPGSFALSLTRNGDLANLMGLSPFPFQTRTAIYQGPELACARDEDNLEVVGVRKKSQPPDNSVGCSKAPSTARALIFHDSMINAMRPYLGSSFSHVRFSSRYPTFDDLKKYVSVEHPKVVIEERIERTIVDVPASAENSVADNGIRR